MRLLSPQRRLGFLTERERVVLIHLMNGDTADDIARAEYVTVATVRTQIRSILMKLGVNSQLAAVALAYRVCWPDGQPAHDEVLAAVIQAVAS